jgi:hypothetical protein
MYNSKVVSRASNSQLISQSGRTCLILSHIPTQSGGAWNELTGMYTPMPREDWC